MTALLSVRLVKRPFAFSSRHLKPLWPIRTTWRATEM
jgi:hypothetical protein